MAGTTSNPSKSCRFSFHKDKRDDWHGQVMMHCLGNDYVWLDSHSIFTFVHRSKCKSLWKLTSKIITLEVEWFLTSSRMWRPRYRIRKASLWPAETHFCRQAVGRWLHSFLSQHPERVDHAFGPRHMIRSYFPAPPWTQMWLYNLGLSEGKVKEMPLISEPELERERVCLSCAMTFTSTSWRQMATKPLSSDYFVYSRTSNID